MSKDVFSLKITKQEIVLHKKNEIFKMSPNTLAYIAHFNALSSPTPISGRVKTVKSALWMHMCDVGGEHCTSRLP